MVATYKAAEAFPPGEYLRDELAERGWTQSEFAEIIGRPPQVVSEILNAKKEITPETAVAVSEALGTSAEVWLNLQTRYRLYLLRDRRYTSNLTPVQRRARKHSNRFRRRHQHRHGHHSINGRTLMALGGAGYQRG